MNNIKEHLKIVDKELKQVGCVIDKIEIDQYLFRAIYLTITTKVENCIDSNRILENHGFGLVVKSGLNHVFKCKISRFLDIIRENNLKELLYG